MEWLFIGVGIVDDRIDSVKRLLSGVVVPEAILILMQDSFRFNDGIEAVVDESFM